MGGRGTDPRRRKPRRRDPPAIAATQQLPRSSSSSPVSGRCTRSGRCFRRSASDDRRAYFRSMIFPVQYRIPVYARWLHQRGRHDVRPTAVTVHSCSTCSRAIPPRWVPEVPRAPLAPARAPRRVPGLSSCRRTMIRCASSRRSSWSHAAPGSGWDDPTTPKRRRVGGLPPRGARPLGRPRAPTAPSTC